MSLNKIINLSNSYTYSCIFSHASFTLQIGLNLGCFNIEMNRCVLKARFIFYDINIFFKIGAFKARFIWFFTLSVFLAIFNPFILWYQYIKLLQWNIYFLYFSAYLGNVQEAIVKYFMFLIRFPFSSDFWTCIFLG